MRYTNAREWPNGLGYDVGRLGFAPMRWQRPTLPGARCKRCGGVALTEYATTQQCEPDSLTPWVVLCNRCRREEATHA